MCNKQSEDCLYTEPERMSSLPFPLTVNVCHVSQSRFIIFRLLVGHLLCNAEFGELSAKTTFCTLHITHETRNAQIPGARSPVATKFCTVEPSICGPSVWYLLHVAFLEPRTLRWLLYFYKICAPLHGTLPSQQPQTWRRSEMLTLYTIN